MIRSAKAGPPIEQRRIVAEQGALQVEADGRKRLHDWTLLLSAMPSGHLQGSVSL